MHRVRMGIIGLNTQGREHLAAALRHPGVEIVALCDTDEGRLREAATLVGPNVTYFKDFGALLESGVVEAVVVAVPHHLHCDITRAAARRGVHLLKEKPLGRTLQEAQAIAAEARHGGIVLQTGVQRRHHATYERLRKHLQDRQERVQTMHIEMTVKGDTVDGVVRPSGWRADYDRSGGGIVIDLGYHAVDLAQHLLGPLDLVSVLMWNRGMPTPAGVVENQAAITAVAGRTWVRIHVGRTGEKLESVVIDCDSGRYRATRNEVTFKSEVIFQGDASWEQTQYEQIEVFVAAIRTGVLAEASIDDQVPVIRFIEKCYAAARLTAVIGEARAS
jgi:predicted dehydrogenase